MNCYFPVLMFSIYDVKQEEMESWLSCSPYSEGGLGQVEAHCCFCLLSSSVRRNIPDDTEDIIEELM